MTAVLLVAHGSRDPRAARSTGALRRAVARARPGWDVRAAFLDHTAPAIAGALTELGRAGHTEAVVVPLLLTEAYHGRVDIPAALAEARAAGIPVGVRLAPVLWPGVGLLDALRRRLGELRTGYDALVLASAGSRDASARQAVAQVAAALDGAVPCLPAFASAASPSPGEAVTALRAAGARRVVVASYFLAPGLLYDRALAGARSAGAVGASAPLGDAPELVALVLDRVSMTSAAPSVEARLFA